MVSKKIHDGFTKQLELCVKTGSYIRGAKRTRQNIISGKTKLLLLSNNIEKTMKSDLEYLAVISNTPVHHFDGDCHSLGLALSRHHGINAASIDDFGIADSEVLLGHKKNATVV
ncbi:MAG: 60S ribosomal protein L30 [Marteilia pararefringens]